MLAEVRGAFGSGSRGFFLRDTASTSFALEDFILKGVTKCGEGLSGVVLIPIPVLENASDTAESAGISISECQSVH